MRKSSFDFTANELQLRSCKSKFINEDYDTAEIVKVDSNNVSILTLAYWQQHKEGFDLKFVGSRPFLDVNRNDFWGLAILGQHILDTWFKREDEI